MYNHLLITHDLTKIERAHNTKLRQEVRQLNMKSESEKYKVVGPPGSRRIAKVTKPYAAKSAEHNKQEDGPTRTPNVSPQPTGV